MNKILMVLAGVALTGAALAADTSSTVTVRSNPFPLGVTPRIGVVRAVASSAGASAGSFTYDLSVPQGKTHTCMTSVRDVSGTYKLASVNISASTVTVASSASATIAVSDTATSMCVFID